MSPCPTGEPGTEFPLRMTDVDELDTALEQEYPLVRPYSRYAGLYDGLGQSDFGRAMLPLIHLAIERYPLSGNRVLDLACGTGTVAILLAREGYDVTGVDRSGEMLEVARGKAIDAGVRVEFLQRDMVGLQMDQRFDLVLCLYDSLNYLLQQSDLEAALAGVAGALAPRGLFVFDMNTLHCLANDWGNQVVEERGPSALLIHRYSFSPESRIGTLELICLRNHPGGIEKFREIHRERGYTREEIRAALDASGLAALEEMSFPDLVAPDDDTSRLICVATNPELSSGRRAWGS